MTEFAGSIGDTKGTFVVTYLRIQTNLETYEIHGTGLNAQANTSAVETAFPFSVPLPENTSIVGFFGRQGDNLNAIGVYVKPSSSLDTDTTQESHGTSSVLPQMIMLMIILAHLFALVFL